VGKNFKNGEFSAKIDQKLGNNFKNREFSSKIFEILLKFPIFENFSQILRLKINRFLSAKID
jgi:hypothetical protein